mmetsp:Transcript_38344/g.65782  ORF Transcript_38344/g.65782 Transcript_38344/m.65782 type:complete len:221 (+) Transcript_38344:32-694(+)|eukprot:CAMPEP_0206155258 /NCGR_PEP_ID=MMETSP1474-20131121/1991_1 /ASSEMBLY_ACC=CAM_ASM_001110 /TAXON_ID=97495 /ORGANISM="Imantonia sp., Strain RCC918" /LENGTH=220 /DNA_ID=CAMNT_0053553833 /DNA_START=32 /DNA_END=694 /DNA_ORIENTATION=+
MQSARPGSAERLSSLGHTSESFAPAVGLASVLSSRAGCDDSPTIRVLCIDDDELQLATVKMLLETISRRHAEHGLPQLEVETVSSAEEGYALFSRARASFHICLSDITLPGLTGLELSYLVSSTPVTEGGQAPIIIGCTETFLDESCLARHGMQDFLPKPVSMARLVSALQKWLPQLNVMANYLTDETSPESSARTLDHVTGLGDDNNVMHPDTSPVRVQ